MKSSGEFSCTIKLRREYDDRTGQRAFGGVSELPFGEPIRQPHLIELGIRRAQKALLNPMTLPHTFLE